MASNLKVDIVKPTATNGSLSLRGDSGGSATANGISVNSSGNTSITGTTTVSQLNADNLRLDGNTLSSTDTNGDINISPNGTGAVTFAKQADFDEGLTVTAGDADGIFRIKRTASETSGDDICDVILGDSSLSFIIDNDSDLDTGTYYFYKKVDGSNVLAPINASNGGFTLVDVDNLRLDGNTISSTDTNGDINLTPNGSGSVVVNGATIDGYATTSEVQGTHTTGTVTSGTTALTVASGTGISDGDYVVGEGITPGTTVSSGGGTTSITLSANANATLSSDPVSFYTSTKLLSPGLVAGQLCRAWVNFNGTGTVAIRASGNVSSITDNGGNGDYTVNFTTAMPDASYCTNITPDSASKSAAAKASTIHSLGTTSSIRVLFFNVAASVYQDAAVVNVSVFR